MLNRTKAVNNGAAQKKYESVVVGSLQSMMFLPMLLAVGENMCHEAGGDMISSRNSAHLAVSLFGLEFVKSIFAEDMVQDAVQEGGWRFYCWCLRT